MVAQPLSCVYWAVMDAVRDYWTRQWAAIDPVALELRPDGRVAVQVHQVVRDLDGGIVADSVVVHLYELRDGLIARMDVQ
jgi:hypothetical protein